MNNVKLICFVNELNDHNILAALTLQPKEIILIYSSYSQSEEAAKDFEAFLNNKLKTTRIEMKPLEVINPYTIDTLVKEIADENTIINLSSSHSSISTFSHHSALKNRIRSVFVDMESKKMYEFGDQIIEIPCDFNLLSIEDFIESTGGEIIDDNSSDLDSKGTKEVIEFILDNYVMWLNVKGLFKNNQITLVSREHPNRITINARGLSNKAKGYLNRFILKLIELELIKVKNIGLNEMNIYCKNRMVKSLILVSGNWLEVITYDVIKGLRGVDDVKTGVVFLWDEKNRYVKNELDVLATLDSRLICISCKDTNKYDEDALNELDVYAEHIGGDRAVKLLVCTKLSYKKTVAKRAGEMGIKIVVFNGDINNFKSQIEEAI